MNVFFYPAICSKEAKRCFQTLQSSTNLPSMIYLPGGCRLNSSQCLSLRSGDIMILFASDFNDIEELINLKEKIEDFRIVIVTGEECRENYPEKYYKLNPRFITSTREMDSLVTVLKNMTE